MAKKIIQYCYFGETAMENAFVQHYFENSEKNPAEVEYEKMVLENSLYYYDELTKTYLLLDIKNKYNEKQKYFKIPDGSRVNYPTTLTKASLVSGSIFNNITPITKLGIQAIPGTRFRINSNKDWIVIGMTGIYELDLLNTSATIVKLQFDETSLDLIDQNKNAYLIIDILSEQGGI